MAIDLAVELTSMQSTPRIDRNQVEIVLNAYAVANNSRLTARHLDVVTSLMETKSLADAADLLCISVHTMRRHVEAILDRSGLPLRGAAELRGWCLGVRDSLACGEIWTLATIKNGLNR